jgi:DNA-binding GntR family transcriptional regulator
MAIKLDVSASGGSAVAPGPFHPDERIMPADSALQVEPARSAVSSLDRLNTLQRLPEAIADILAQSIATGALVGGERIVETSLAATLGVSRVPVREALKILHTQGIIEGGGHRGYRVAMFSDHVIASVQEARIALELLFWRDAIEAWRSGRADVSALDDVIAQMARAARVEDLPAMLGADVAFHTAICEAAGNPIFKTLWTAIARHVLIILNLARFRDTDLSVVMRRHEALRDQIKDLVDGRMPMDRLRSILEAHFLAERTGRAPLPSRR